MLVSDAVVQGGIAVVAVDLKTGQVQRLSRVAEQGIEKPHISGRYVAWVESAPELGRDVRQLHVFDLAQAREFVVEQGLIYQPDLKDSILVWQDYRGQGWGTYGYDLDTNQAFTVAESPSTRSAARVCSKEWVIYLQNIQAGWPGSAELRAHNLMTDEDIFVGQIPFPRSGALPERQYDCDSNRVAWISVQMQQSILIHKQHIYNLNTRSDRVLDVSIRVLPSVLLSGDVLISSVGYDLARDVPFSVPSKIPPRHILIGSILLLSKDRTVWIADEPDGSQGIYSAPIIRK